MACGQPRHEVILLNHEALWFPLYEKPAQLPNMAQHLPELRRLLTQGQYKLAHEFWQDKLRESDYDRQGPPIPNPFHPAFDLLLSGTATFEMTDYQQHLDFETAEATAIWLEGGTVYERGLFVSRRDFTVVVNLRASKSSALNMDIALNAHAPEKEIYPKHIGLSKNYLLTRKAYCGDPITYHTTAEDGWLSLIGRYWDGRHFGGVARVVQKAGSLDVWDNVLSAKDADELLILLKLFVNEKDPGTAIEQLRADICRLPTDYDELFRSHAEQHGELFRRMSLDLAAGQERQATNAELLAKAEQRELSPALVERLFEYGRYLLICSSHVGGWPANLQGVWSGTWTPSWASDYTVDENVQMCYWQALPGAMPEVTQPYFDYFDSLVPDWRVNARQFFGCRGIVSDICHSDHGLKNSQHVFTSWTAGAGWLAQLYYDYYLFTDDQEFLKHRALPFMKEVALFYEDFLVADSNDQYLFSPSVSPENVPENLCAADAPVGGVGSGTPTAVNATMDIAVAKEVLTNLIAGCKILGIEKAKIKHWYTMLTTLPSYEIGPDGALKEWAHSDLHDRHVHRHISHLYPLFPGFEVSADEGDPALRRGCRVLLEKKLHRNGDFGAWSWAHLALGFTRLTLGEKVLECLRQVSLTCAPGNLLSFYRPGFPFQLDAHCGFSSAVLEVLVFSRPGMVKLLPALPATWRKGRAQGMLCRGGIDLDIEWNMDKREANATLRSRSPQKLAVRLPSQITEIECDLPIAPSPLGPRYRQIQLPAGTMVVLAMTGATGQEWGT